MVGTEFCVTDDWRCLDLWIRHIVDRKVRKLSLEMHNTCPYYFVLGRSLVSQHLTTLVLLGVEIAGNFCNFSNSPNLEHLEIAHCRIGTSNQISSEFLKHLSFTGGSYFVDNYILISVPNLVSLRLDMHLDTVPILGSMPMLKEAFVREATNDDCVYGDCFTSDGVDELDNKCCLLEGLSNAENLALMSDYERAVFIRDLEWCLTFGNLRILLLNESWCVDPDFNALTCILKHSPVLETLTLQLFSEGPNHNVEMIGRHHQIERSATISKHLKTVEVKCSMLDEKIHKVLKFFGALGISKRITSTLDAEVSFLYATQNKH
ncbi:hypothetical protein ACP4OV_015029 [Aristida adscensionis]